MIFKHPKQHFAVEVIIHDAVCLYEYSVWPKFANEGSSIRFNLAQTVITGEQDGQ